MILLWYFGIALVVLVVVFFISRKMYKLEGERFPFLRNLVLCEIPFLGIFLLLLATYLDYVYHWINESHRESNKSREGSGS